MVKGSRLELEVHSVSWTSHLDKAFSSLNVVEETPEFKTVAAPGVAQQEASVLYGSFLFCKITI